MVNIIVIAVLIIPWLIIPQNNVPDPTRLIKACFFDLTMLGIIVMAIKDGLKFEYKNKYLAWLAGWVFITLIFNWYYPIVRGIGYNASMIDSMIHFTLAIVAIMLICSNLERIDFVRIAKAICISATLVSVFCIFQGIGLDPMKHIVRYGWKEHRHIAALLDHPDIVGNYLCMTLPFFLYLGKPKYYICFAVCLIALLLSQSSLSIGAAFIGLFVYMVFRFSRLKRVVFGLLALQMLFVLFCFLSPQFNKFGNGFTGRTNAWKMMVERDNNPLFGQGLGVVKTFQVTTDKPSPSSTMPEEIKQTAQNVWIFAHNDYLETYCSLGGLGLFLMILVIIHAFRRFNYKEDNQIGFAYYGAFVSFLLIMIGSFPMEMPPVALNGLLIFCAMQKT